MNEKSDCLFTALKIFGFSYLKKQKSLKLRSAHVFKRYLNNRNERRRKQQKQLQLQKQDNNNNATPPPPPPSPSSPLPVVPPPPPTASTTSAEDILRDYVRAGPHGRKNDWRENK